MKRAVQVDGLRYSVNFPYLQEQYPNVVAWLLQTSTGLNHPVMQAEDNDFYLERLYNERSNKGGSLFLDSGNAKDFVDANSYIYGHNMKSGEMLGFLHKYKDQAFYNANPQMTLLTPYGDFQIDIFAATMSLVEDETSWRLKQFERKAEFEAYIAELQKHSFFRSNIVPEWGDQFLVLCTCTNIRHGERYVVYGRMRPIQYGSEESIGLTKIDMDRRKSTSGIRAVGSLGYFQLYSQNDPLWESFRYETRGSKKKRSFGDGGNGPTAVAMAIANMVPINELSRLYGYARSSSGFTFCTHSVNEFFCNRLHAQYQIQTPKEFLRYLPIAIASFTTGNNLWGQEARAADKNGSSMAYLPYIAGIYGLDLRVSLELSDALEALRQGGMVICVTGGRQSPFTSGSQYVVLAGMDAEGVYILDPYGRSSYPRNATRRVLEVLTPNAVRVRHRDIDQIGLNSFFILTRGQEQP